MFRLNSYILLVIGLFLVTALMADKLAAEEAIEISVEEEYQDVRAMLKAWPEREEFEGWTEFEAARRSWVLAAAKVTRDFVVAHPASEHTPLVVSAHMALHTRTGLTEQEKIDILAEFREAVEGTPAMVYFQLHDLRAARALEPQARYEALKMLAEENPGNASVSAELVGFVFAENLEGAVLRAALEELQSMDCLESGARSTIAGKLRRIEEIGESFDISFVSLDGESVSTESLRGKVVIIDFWATWCPPCVAELPKLARLYEEHRDDGLEIIGVCLERHDGILEKFLAGQPIQWPLWFEGPEGAQQDFSRSWGITGIPTMFLVGRDGTLRSSNASQKLDDLLPALLAEPMPESVAAGAI